MTERYHQSEDRSAIIVVKRNVEETWVLKVFKIIWGSGMSCDFLYHLIVRKSSNYSKNSETPVWVLGTGIFCRILNVAQFLGCFSINEMVPKYQNSSLLVKISNLSEMRAGTRKFGWWLIWNWQLTWTPCTFYIVMHCLSIRSLSHYKKKESKRTAINLQVCSTGGCYHRLLIDGHRHYAHGYSAKIATQS